MSGNSKRVFLAGASGVVGRRLAPLLKQSGWKIIGSTRSVAAIPALEALGVEPVIVDVFDAERLSAMVRSAQPSLVMHQLTDLPAGLDPAQMSAAAPRNARIRDEGTRNLIRAALEASARRFVAQSIAFVYAPGREPHLESDPLAIDAEGDLGIHTRAVASLERQVLEASSLVGVVLRYGLLYGPGTGFDRPVGPTALHVDAAAYAAQLAAESSAVGLFNIAENDSTVVCDRARTVLNWRADFRLQD